MLLFNSHLRFFAGKLLSKWEGPYVIEEVYHSGAIKINNFEGTSLMTHKYRGSIVVLSISKSVEPNEEQKEMISGFQQGILCKH